MVAKILFAVSAEESRFQFNGALLKLKDGALEMVATDGHRLALVEGGLRAAPARARTRVLVPRKALQELQRFEGDGEPRLPPRRAPPFVPPRPARADLPHPRGTFPDYERVIAKDNDKKVLFDRKPLVRGGPARRAPDRRPGARRAPPVHGRPGGDLGRQPGLGEAVEEVACDYDGPEFRLGIDPDSWASG